MSLRLIRNVPMPYTSSWSSSTYKWAAHDSMIIKESVQIRGSHRLLDLDHPLRRSLRRECSIDYSESFITWEGRVMIAYTRGSYILDRPYPHVTGLRGTCLEQRSGMVLLRSWMRAWWGRKTKKNFRHAYLMCKEGRKDVVRKYLCLASRSVAGTHTARGSGSTIGGLPHGPLPIYAPHNLNILTLSGIQCTIHHPSVRKCTRSPSRHSEWKDPRRG
jgi:hypothetical protein